jgi:hypothetical protein
MNQQWIWQELVLVSAEGGSSQGFRVYVGSNFGNFDGLSVAPSNSA